MVLTFENVRNNSAIQTYIAKADEALSALGYTEHSFPHVLRVCHDATYILETLGYSKHEIELVKIAGYMHDIGNLVNRVDHSQSGAVMAFRLLDKMGMKAEEIARIVTAIGNHDEKTAFPVNEVAAALIIADKSDVRRSRVREEERATISEDIHDRVNFAVEKSRLAVDVQNKKMVLYITIDEKISRISEYFEIFLDRMMLCRRAAAYFGMQFEVNINGSTVM